MWDLTLPVLRRWAATKESLRARRILEGWFLKLWPLDSELSGYADNDQGHCNDHDKFWLDSHSRRILFEEPEQTSASCRHWGALLPSLFSAAHRHHSMSLAFMKQ